MSTVESRLSLDSATVSCLVINRSAGCGRGGRLPACRRSGSTLHRSSEQRDFVWRQRGDAGSTLDSLVESIVNDLGSECAVWKA